MTDDPAMSWGWEDLGSMPTGIASCIIIVIILSFVTSAVPTLWACHVDQGATPTKVWAFDFSISWEIPSKKPKETIHSTGQSFSLGIWLKTVAFCSFSTWFWSVLKPCNFQFYLSSSQNRRVEHCKLKSDVIELTGCVAGHLQKIIIRSISKLRMQHADLFASLQYRSLWLVLEKQEN